jgi:hypothetical protein
MRTTCARGKLRANHPCELDAVRPRDHEVHDREVKRTAGHRTERCLRVVRGLDLEAFDAQADA